MTMAFGGSYKQESPEARALKSINQDSYDYRDQGKLLTKLTGDVSYMAQYMRTMQKGIDAANQNVIEQITGFINEIMVVIGGQGNTGFDFGDLKYVFQAIGSLFGFDQQTGIASVFPINLFSAGWHFFSTYILPLNNFGDAIDNFIDMSIATVLDWLGEVPVVGQAVQMLAVWISDFRDTLRLGGEFLNGLFADWTAPLVAAVKNVVSVVQEIVDWFTGIANSAFSNLFPWAKKLPQMNASNLIQPTNIPAIDASKVTTGTFNSTQIPNLDAGKITTGTLGTSTIPNLDAGKITSGTLGTSTIPNLDAGKISSGTLGVSRIPGLPATQITSGTLTSASMVPALDASKITTGTLGTGVVPNITRDMSTDLQATINNMYSGWYGTSGTGTTADVTSTVNGIKTAVQGGWTTETITTSGTWTRPWSAGSEPREFWAICISGGAGGGGGRTGVTGTSWIGGSGGKGGTYLAQQIDPTTIPSTVTATIGAGGSGGKGGRQNNSPTAGAGSAGGDTSFGSLAVAFSNAVSSSIASVFGFYDASSSGGGNGGQGVHASGSPAATAGLSTPLASGGAIGTVSSPSVFTPGGDGAAASLTGQTRSGGGGGGGGVIVGGVSASSPYRMGGHGGFPGGGGGGGNAYPGGSSSAYAGSGGNGANGAIVLLWR